MPKKRKTSGVIMISETTMKKIRNGESGSWKRILIYHPVATGIDAKEEVVDARIAAESLRVRMGDESV